MSSHSKRALMVRDQLVVTLENRVALAGEDFNITEKPGIFQFIQGCGQIFPALEKKIYEMKNGDSKEVPIAAADTCRIIKSRIGPGAAANAEINLCAVRPECPVFHSAYRGRSFSEWYLLPRGSFDRLISVLEHRRAALRSDFDRCSLRDK